MSQTATCPQCRTVFLPDMQPEGPDLQPGREGQLLEPGSPEERLALHAALGRCLEALKDASPEGVVIVAQALIALCSENRQTTCTWKASD